MKRKTQIIKKIKKDKTSNQEKPPQSRHHQQHNNMEMNKPKTT